MKLQNVLPHMAGELVNVNGNHYRLDAKGIVEIANEKDVQKLLADKATWRRYVEREPIANVPTVPVNAVIPIVTPTEETVIGEEWPDPKVTMSIKQLHEIADAYQVKYDAKTSKKALVDLIMIAMYGEE